MPENFKNYSRIAAEIFNRPLAIESNYAYSMLSFLGKRMGFDDIDVGVELEPVTRQASTTPQDRYIDENSEYAEWYIRPDGTAVVPIAGTLTHKRPMFASLGRSYQSLVNDAKAAHEHPDVDRVALLLDSNGGAVSGCRNCAMQLSELFEASEKPTWSFVDESMFSAAMWTGSTANRIVMPKTAENGSVGVIWLHASIADQLKNEGVKVTFIHAGAKKAQGNPYEDLSNEDLADFQEEIERYGEIFYEAVAEQRGISVDAVRDTEAGTFMGEQAVEIGFADEVMEKEEFFSSFAEVSTSNQTISIPSSGNTTTEATNMPKENEEVEDTKSLSARLDKLESENQKLREEKAEQETAAREAKEENERLVAAQDRRNKVMSFAVETDLVAEAEEMLENELFAGFPAEACIDQLAKIAKASGKEDKAADKDADNKDEDLDESELGDDARALLANARRNAKGNSTDVSNRGEGTGDGKAASGSTDKEKYRATVDDDREVMFGHFITSAKLVKDNLKRKSI